MSALRFPLLTILLLFAAALPAAETVKLTGVHICCGKCKKAIGNAAVGVQDATTEISKGDQGNVVTITAPDAESAQQVVDGIAAAGLYGTSDREDIAIAVAEVDADTTSDGALTIVGTHLCCGGCKRAVTKALSDVPGASGVSIEGDVIIINGSVPVATALSALQEHGFSGSVE